MIKISRLASRVIEKSEIIERIPLQLNEKEDASMFLSFSRRVYICKDKELTRRRSKDLSRYRLSQSIAWRLHFPRLVVAVVVVVRGYLYASLACTRLSARISVDNSRRVTSKRPRYGVNHGALEAPSFFSPAPCGGMTKSHCLR